MRRFIEMFWCNPDCTTCWSFFFIVLGLFIAAATIIASVVVG